MRLELSQEQQVRIAAEKSLHRYEDMNNELNNNYTILETKYNDNNNDLMKLKQDIKHLTTRHSEELDNIRSKYSTQLSELELKANNNLILNYKDNGNGCFIEDLSEIYSPFFTTLRKTGHSGLWLTIVYNLLKHKLNGTIEAINNCGLEFKIVIPL